MRYAERSILMKNALILCFASVRTHKQTVVFIKFLLCDPYYGQLCITQSQKQITEFGIGAEF